LAAALRLADDDLELDERELVERLLPDDLLLPDDERLRELLDERLDPLDFFRPPEPPLLRRSAMSCSPS